MTKRIITAESVTSGHPDKLADLIADTILDECLAQDAESRVACEVMLVHDKVLIAGEITTLADVDYIGVAKAVIAEVGYSPDGVEFELRIAEQSEDIANAVNGTNSKILGEASRFGAGDQGLMVGYATNETDDMMPLPVVLAHQLTARLEECRKESIIAGLLPDGKSQVSVEYFDGKPIRITSVVVSAQHEESKDLAELAADIKEHIVGKALKGYDLTDTDIIINPSGKFVLGGFAADTGLTGRKLMVDSYGGAAKHGGGAFCGKDASKVDRSGAYMARYIAKNIVAAKLAERCEVTLSYAIGKAEPTSVDINTFSTATVSEDDIKQAVLSIFDLTPQGIISELELQLPVFSQTAVGGHFGKEYLMWEQTGKAEQLRKILG